MPIPRFFVPARLEPAAIGQRLALPEAVAHHAVRVLRLGVGDALTLFTGHGGEYAATLVRIDKRGAEVRLDGFDPVERESSLEVVLAQAIVANDAMDYAIRKATEMGAGAILPLVTARSAPIPGGERGDKRLAHWRQVAIAACEQCGRNRVPDVAPAQPLTAWLAAWHGSGIVLTPSAKANLAALRMPAPPVALAVGPEGGWDASDLAAMRASGFAAASLGPRLLRTETAGTAALASMQALWGDDR